MIRKLRIKFVDKRQITTVKRLQKLAFRSSALRQRDGHPFLPSIQSFFYAVFRSNRYQCSSLVSIVISLDFGNKVKYTRLSVLGIGILAKFGFFRSV